MNPARCAALLVTVLGGSGGAPATPFDPTQVTGLLQGGKSTGLVYQDAGITLANDNDEVVGRVNDLSTNATPMNQTTAGLKPLFKTNVFGAIPDLRGDGSNDILIASLAANVNVNAFTLFLLLNPISVGNFDVFVCLGNSGNSNQNGDNIFRQEFVTATANAWYRGDNATRDTAAETTALASYPALYTILSNTNDTKIYRNQALVATITSSKTTTADRLILLARNAAGTAGFDGGLPEWYLYNSVLSAPNIALIEEYFGDRYSLGFP